MVATIARIPHIFSSSFLFVFRFAPSQPPCPSSPRPHPVCVASLSLAGGVRSLPPRFPPRRSLLRPHPHSIRIRNRLQDPPSDRGRQEGGSIFLLCHWINIRCQESLRIPKESQRILPFSPTLPPRPHTPPSGRVMNSMIQLKLVSRRDVVSVVSVVSVADILKVSTSIKECSIIER